MSSKYYCYLRKADVDSAPVVIDWADFLKGEEAVAAQSWEATEGVTITNVPTIEGSVTRAVVSGGQAGRTYTVTCQIETTTGQIDRRAVCVLVNKCP